MARELALPGRDLALDATRRTRGETLTLDDIDLMMDGVPENTRRTLRAAWKKVLRFCGENGYVECPMPEETCVKLFDWAWRQEGRYGRPTSPESIKLMLWAITKAHHVAMRPDGVRGYVSPVNSELVQRAMKGYVRRYLRAGHRPDMASPVTPVELEMMIARCDLRSPRGLRDALALALCYDMGARASELADLRWEDTELVVWEAEKLRIPPQAPERIELRETDHIVIHVPMSKTDQEGYGDEVLLYAHPPAHARTCPIRLLLAWADLLHQRGLAPRGTVLRAVHGGGPLPRDGRPRDGHIMEEPMSYMALKSMYARVLRNTPEVSRERRHLVLHGLRAGSAEAAAERGADTPELNRHYRWSQKGVTAQRYAARGRKKRENPARRIWGGDGVTT